MFDPGHINRALVRCGIKPCHVFGLLAAATAGSVAGAVYWIVASRLFYGLTGPTPITFLHWFMSDMVGFITFGPFVIGFFFRSAATAASAETIEGFVALLALALMLTIIIPLPSRFWEAALPIAWLFPMLLWLTARFAAAAAAPVSITVVSTTVFGIGHFWRPQTVPRRPHPQAQSTILFVAVCGFVLARGEIKRSSLSEFVRTTREARSSK